MAKPPSGDRTRDGWDMGYADASVSYSAWPAGSSCSSERDLECRWSRCSPAYYATPVSSNFFVKTTQKNIIFLYYVFFFSNFGGIFFGVEANALPTAL